MTDEEQQAFLGEREERRQRIDARTADFVADLERVLGRPIARRAPGRKASGAVPDPARLPL